MMKEETFMKSRISEHSFNLTLAHRLKGIMPGWEINAERSRTVRNALGQKPDIICSPGDGSRPIIIETEWMPAATVEQDARQRLGQVLDRDGWTIDVVLAIRVPDNASYWSDTRLHEELDDLPLELALLQAGQSNETKRWPEQGHIQVYPPELARIIELASASEDRVAQGMTIIDDAVSDSAVILRRHCQKATGPLEAMARELYQEDGEQTTCMAFAIMANALIFQTAIAGTGNVRRTFVVQTPAELDCTGRSRKAALLAHWTDILEKINYWPIFDIARRLLKPVPDGVAGRILDTLTRAAGELAELGTTSRHDLSGRMFQRLITDRKFLATFYTLPASAALLAELAVARLGVDWADPDAVTALRIGDFACGTGALLHAAYDAVLSRVRQAGGDDRELHARMMEQALIGTDIMPAATHLTTSVLSSTHSGEPFSQTRIVTLPYGPDATQESNVALGALDLIVQQEMRSLLGTTARRVHGDKDAAPDTIDIPHGSLDLVIMNPPFTRVTQHNKGDMPNPAFAGLNTTADEQRMMSRKLRVIMQKSQGNMAGNGIAGLASHFVDLAHAKLKVGGVMALVIPSTCMLGQAWDSVRRKLNDEYRHITVVGIAKGRSKERSFSWDTGIGEALVLAQKGNVSKSTPPVLYASIEARPASVADGVMMGQAIHKSNSNNEAGFLRHGKHDVFGQYMRGTMKHGGLFGLFNMDVGRMALSLASGHLSLPRLNANMSIPVTRLANVAERGLYHIDICNRQATRAPFCNALPLKGGGNSDMAYALGA